MIDRIRERVLGSLQIVTSFVLDSTKEKEKYKSAVGQRGRREIR